LPGNAVITKGYKLPAEKVIHAVGPYFDEEGKPQPEVLRDTYRAIFRLVDENQIRSIALCPISTGFYGHPKPLAAEISISSTLDWLNTKTQEERDRIRVIFCAFDNDNLGAYKGALAKILPQ
jgi:O-acetyl-ADP-ribose deacetylase